jgi:hypothetical protein
MVTIAGGGSTAITFGSGAFSFVFLCDEDVLEDFEVEDDDESLDEDELLLLLDLDDTVASLVVDIFTGPSISSSSDLIQPFMSGWMSRSLLEPSPSKLVSIFNFLILNFN